MTTTAVTAATAFTPPNRKTPPNARAADDGTRRAVAVRVAIGDPEPQGGAPQRFELADRDPDGDGVHATEQDDPAKREGRR